MTSGEQKTMEIFQSIIPMVDILEYRIRVEIKRRAVDGEKEPVTAVFVRNSCLQLIAEELGKLTGNWLDPVRETIFFNGVRLRPFVASRQHEDANAHLGYFIFISERGEPHGI